MSRNQQQSKSSIPPQPPISGPSIPLRRMYRDPSPPHLPSVPASIVAAHNPDRISGWWNMYDDLTSGPLPSDFETIDLSTDAVVGRRPTPSAGVSSSPAPNSSLAPLTRGPHTFSTEAVVGTRGVAGVEVGSSSSKYTPTPPMIPASSSKYSPTPPVLPASSSKYSPTPPEAVAGPGTRSRENSVDSIDFFNGKVVGKVDTKGKGKGKGKAGAQPPKRPARREGAGPYEA